MPISSQAYEIDISPEKGKVSAALLLPESPIALYVMAHGAGAGMQHPFMLTMSEALAQAQIATLRFQFPYMQMGRKIPDGKATLFKSIAQALLFAKDLQLNVPLFAGGKSMGGRMTSVAAAEGLLPSVQGIIFLGFPLHAPGKPSSNRAEHLIGLDTPLLFLQGTRDTLAQRTLMEDAYAKLDPTKATLHFLAGADHSFKVLKRSGIPPASIISSLTQHTRNWIQRLI